MDNYNNAYLHLTQHSPIRAANLLSSQENLKSIQNGNECAKGSGVRCHLVVSKCSQVASNAGVITPKCVICKIGPSCLFFLQLRCATDPPCN